MLACILVGLAVRRRWVARHGGTFECSLRRRSPRRRPANASGTEAPSTDWVLGVARYSGEYLEWFRFFSVFWWPKHRFLRSEVSVVDHRTPTKDEAVALYADQEVVTVEIGGVGRSEQRDLAMTPDSLTGMLSWLEAAPPGIRRDRY